MTVSGESELIGRGENAVEELDDVDRGILRLLQSDGRIPYRQIARELGISEGTVRIRAGRMQDSGVLNIVAIADPFRLGYRVLAFLLIKAEPGRHDHIVESLTEWEEATYVSTCVGNADIYVQLVCRDNDHLNNLLHTRIPDIGGVRECQTYMELKMHKVSYGYAPS
ncbi:Lrp/AsnC family transcriptional regulator [Rhodococcus qingshengii]|jgi:Lrp/AsnC family transcriptional regulator for asnA, asnC and gidA|uniref:Lrp/AsnC family transcriptional regulator n=1 Tax=Rhodococcus qingshengii TaxID=334542 RepID=UPI0006D23C1A|nr:Lrp/AsnC family transcriptional regulator [Rhodococcus qingshengii]MCW0193221.1 Lrp/AsnC family transcriptional regulator [Rhodococcus sp. (in: high G+C Gram-positive bacteria)]